MSSAIGTGRRWMYWIAAAPRIERIWRRIELNDASNKLHHRSAIS